MDVTTVGFISGSEIKSRVKELPLLEISQDVFFSIYHLGIFGMFFALIGFGSQKVFSCFLYFCALIYSVSWFCLFCFSFVLGCFVVWSSLVIFVFFLNIIICLFFACMFSLMIGQYTILNVQNICD